MPLPPGVLRGLEAWSMTCQRRIWKLSQNCKNPMAALFVYKCTRYYVYTYGFSYARTCIGIPCNFGTCSIYADKRNKMSFLEEFYDCSKDFVSLAGVDIHSLMMLSFCSSSLSFFSIRLSRSVVDAREALNTKPFFRYYQFKAVIIGYHGCCFRYRASLHSG